MDNFGFSRFKSRLSISCLSSNFSGLNFVLAKNALELSLTVFALLPQMDQQQGSTQLDAMHFVSTFLHFRKYTTPSHTFLERDGIYTRTKTYAFSSKHGGSLQRILDISVTGIVFPAKIPIFHFLSFIG